MADPSSNANNPPIAATPAASSRWRVNAHVAETLRGERAFHQRQIPHRLPLPTDAAPSPAPRVDVSPPADAPHLLRDDRIPAWLVSLVVHMVAILLLAFLTVGEGAERMANTLTVAWTQAAGAGGALRVVATRERPVAPIARTTPLDAAVEVDSDVHQTVVPVTSPALGALGEIESGPDVQSEWNDILPQLLRSMSTGELGDRSDDGRASAVGSGATTQAAEDAIDRALRWLAQHQHNDGGWSFRLEDPHGPCHGQCDNERENIDDAPVPRTAATGLALLAFMGAGHTHQSGEYADVVRRGIYYLRSQASESSMGIDLQNGSMYGHGIATLALAEAFVMTGDEELRELVEGASMFAAGAQHTSGGWGYVPGGPPDITQTAWQIVAMKTAEQKGVGIPTLVVPNAKAYLETLGNSDLTRFGYKTPEPKLSTTAIGLLLRLYFGALPRQTSMREALDWIVAQGPSPTNVYYDYYAMLVLHHTQHVGAMDFARALRDHLIATQANDGHESGSWNFEDRYGSVGGRLYTTAMCVLILETPYRYVPAFSADRGFQL